MENATKKAINGGYGKGMVRGKNATKIDYQDYQDIPQIAFENRNNYIEKAIDTVLLDPLFWQALGKQQGWKESEWKSHRAGLLEHIDKGGNIDDFFYQILK